MADAETVHAGETACWPVSQGRWAVQQFYLFFQGTASFVGWHHDAEARGGSALDDEDREIIDMWGRMKIPMFPSAQ